MNIEHQPNDIPTHKFKTLSPIEHTSVQNRTEHLWLQVEAQSVDVIDEESHPEPNFSITSFFRACELLLLSFMTEMERFPICSNLSFSHPSKS